jgi:hypothetical protein
MLYRAVPCAAATASSCVSARRCAWSRWPALRGGVRLPVLDLGAVEAGARFAQFLLDLGEVALACLKHVRGVGVSCGIAVAACS